MFVLSQNPFYANHIRHKTDTSVQNKLNGGSSSPSSSSPSPSSPSENRTNVSESLIIKPYCRLLLPQAIRSCSAASGNRCYNSMKHILNNHAKLAQGVMVR